MAVTRFLLTVALVCGSVFAQRPSNPDLLIPEKAPELEYVSVPFTLALPDGIKMGAPASVTWNPKGHLFVLNRGEHPVMEFDENEKYVRSYGEGLFTRVHGLRLDPQGNIWVADFGGHTVVKMDPQGKVLLTLGIKGMPGEWNEAAGTRLLREPNDVAFGRDGTVFVAEGHTPGVNGDPRVLKFDKDGKFLKSWGGKGSAPGKFEIAHGLAVDAKGQLWVMDRENQRIQVFDQDGNYVTEHKFAGLPCSIHIGSSDIYMVNGFAGQLLHLDLNGKVLAATGKLGPASELGAFGEAHFVGVSPKGDLYVADTVNSTLQRFVKRK